MLFIKYILLELPENEGKKKWNIVVYMYLCLIFLLSAYIYQSGLEEGNIKKVTYNFLLYN